MPRKKTSFRMWLNQETTAGYFFCSSIHNRVCCVHCRTDAHVALFFVL